MPSHTLCQNSENGASFSLWIAPSFNCCFLGASPFSLVLAPVRFGIWHGGGQGWSGSGERSWFLPTPGIGPRCSALGPHGVPCTSGLGWQMFCLVAQAEFRVPAAADLRTELSFPRQKRGRAARSARTPKALLATPPNSSELSIGNFRPGQKEANQDALMGAAGRLTFSRVTGRLG